MKDQIENKEQQDWSPDKMNGMYSCVIEAPLPVRETTVWYNIAVKIKAVNLLSI